MGRNYTQRPCKNGCFFNSQVEYYRKVLAILKEHVDLGKYIKFLDVGCGTGALCYVLNFNIIPHKNYDIIDTMV